MKDVAWESVEGRQCGEIKFRKQKSRIKVILKFIAFVLIAAISGAISSLYIVNRKYSEISKINENNLNNKNTISNIETEIPSNTIGRVAEMVGPAVVGITSSTRDTLNVESKSTGSGIIFDPNGYIVTNYHVIDGADQINVKLANSGKSLNAKYIGFDATSDLAIIKIEAKNLPTAKFGDSSKVRVGDVAIAIGNPIGEEFAGSVTAGIISALNRKIQYGGSVYKVLQTDAAINPGNSGGALCNAMGEVIGINSLKLGGSIQQNIEGIGFAIAINEANHIVEQIMKYGRVARPRIGIYGKDAVSEENKNIKGVYVQEVVKNSGAAAAGIRPTDIIIELDGKKITGFQELLAIIEKHKIGDIVKCKIWRNGNTINVTITLSDIVEDK
ncbi:trypsin-like peptidase domain-containing protein [Clostridium sp. ZS2-4]|nr:trypsin-like peptidase domain-containing protein [Clostridium sp. ZS2-4]MCY6356585.1 trypsin-like peptidase domain-containing protein [Clostridium sp. ZS2-4]